MQHRRETQKVKHVERRVKERQAGGRGKRRERRSRGGRRHLRGAFSLAPRTGAPAAARPCRAAAARPARARRCLRRRCKRRGKGKGMRAAAHLCARRGRTSCIPGGTSSACTCPRSRWRDASHARPPGQTRHERSARQHGTWASNSGAPAPVAERRRPVQRAAGSLAGAAGGAPRRLTPSSFFFFFGMAVPAPEGGDSRPPKTRSRLQSCVEPRRRPCRSIDQV